MNNREHASKRRPVGLTLFLFSTLVLAGCDDDSARRHHDCSSLQGEDKYECDYYNHTHSNSGSNFFLWYWMFHSNQPPANSYDPSKYGPLRRQDNLNSGTYTAHSFVGSANFAATARSSFSASEAAGRAGGFSSGASGARAAPATAAVARGGFGATGAAIGGGGE